VIGIDRRTARDNLSLKKWIERADGRPHPYDVKIHPGDDARTRCSRMRA
jgi:hypothetical protein